MGLILVKQGQWQKSLPFSNIYKTILDIEELHNIYVCAANKSKLPFVKTKDFEFATTNTQGCLNIKTNKIVTIKDKKDGTFECKAKIWVKGVRKVIMKVLKADNYLEAKYLFDVSLQNSD